VAKDPQLVEFPDADGNTPVHIASSTGNLEVLNVLLATEFGKEAVNQPNLSLSEYARVSAVAQGGAGWRLGSTSKWEPVYVGGAGWCGLRAGVCQHSFSWLGNVGVGGAGWCGSETNRHCHADSPPPTTVTLAPLHVQHH
jgi:hypothetical protein